jgi:hypothetical protein
MKGVVIVPDSGPNDLYDLRKMAVSTPRVRPDRSIEQRRTRHDQFGSAIVPLLGRIWNPDVNTMNPVYRLATATQDRDLKSNQNSSVYYPERVTKSNQPAVIINWCTVEDRDKRLIATQQANLLKYNKQVHMLRARASAHEQQRLEKNVHQSNTVLLMEKSLLGQQQIEDNVMKQIDHILQLEDEAKHQFEGEQEQEQDAQHMQHFNDDWQMEDRRWMYLMQQQEHYETSASPRTRPQQHHETSASPYTRPQQHHNETSASPRTRPQQHASPYTHHQEQRAHNIQSINRVVIDLTGIIIPRRAPKREREDDAVAPSSNPRDHWLVNF